MSIGISSGQLDIIFVYSYLLRDFPVGVEVDHLEARCLVQGRCLPTLEHDAERVAWAFRWVLQLEILLFIMAELLKDNNLLIPLDQGIVPLGPPRIAMLVARSQVADDPCPLVLRILRFFQFCLKVSELASRV